MIKSFGSDNHSGVHPQILQAISEANQGHVRAYGDDHWTKQARDKYCEVFGMPVETFFVFNGTGANVLALQSLLKPYESILAAETAHIYCDECGAPEKNTGSKIIPIRTLDGKLTPALIQPFLEGVRGNPHHTQPRVVSISQLTELGTLYSEVEIRELGSFLKKNDLMLHMDGARIANAAVQLGSELGKWTFKAGVDVLSFGATKNGCLSAEAVVVSNSKLAENMPYLRKQSMQLSSKHRFISAQFLAYFKNNLWLKLAEHSNEMARYFSKNASLIDGVKIEYLTQGNGVFARIPTAWISHLQEVSQFYVWKSEGDESVVRWMCSFDTEQGEIDLFLEKLKEKSKN